jgi:hypothetical protein
MRRPPYDIVLLFLVPTGSAFVAHQLRKIASVVRKEVERLAHTVASADEAHL